MDIFSPRVHVFIPEIIIKRITTSDALAISHANNRPLGFSFRSDRLFQFPFSVDVLRNSELAVANLRRRPFGERSSWSFGVRARRRWEPWRRDSASTRRRSPRARRPASENDAAGRFGRPIDTSERCKHRRCHNPWACRSACPDRCPIIERERNAWHDPVDHDRWLNRTGHSALRIRHSTNATRETATRQKRERENRFYLEDRIFFDDQDKRRWRFVLNDVDVVVDNQLSARRLATIDRIGRSKISILNRDRHTVLSLLQRIPIVVVPRRNVWLNCPQSDRCAVDDEISSLESRIILSNSFDCSFERADESPRERKDTERIRADYDSRVYCSTGNFVHWRSTMEWIVDLDITVRHTDRTSVQFRSGSSIVSNPFCLLPRERLNEEQQETKTVFFSLSLFSRVTSALERYDWFDVGRGASPMRVSWRNSFFRISQSSIQLDFDRWL